VIMLDGWLRSAKYDRKPVHNAGLCSARIRLSFDIDCGMYADKITF
jgi:hypothetical protein